MSVSSPSFFLFSLSWPSTLVFQSFLELFGVSLNRFKKKKKFFLRHENNFISFWIKSRQEKNLLRNLVTRFHFPLLHLMLCLFSIWLNLLKISFGSRRKEKEVRLTRACVSHFNMLVPICQPCRVLSVCLLSYALFFSFFLNSLFVYF